MRNKRMVRILTVVLGLAMALPIFGAATVNSIKGVMGGADSSQTSDTAEAAKAIAESTKEPMPEVSKYTGKITYLKEADFDPAYPGCELIKYTPADPQTKDVKIQYTVKNADPVKVYETYRSIFVTDGWERVVDTPKNNFVSFKKGDHKTVIATKQSSEGSKDVTILMMTK